MKNKGWKITCSILALALSVLSSAIAYGFMGETATTFATKFFCGLIFIANPIFVLHLVVLLWQKNK